MREQKGGREEGERVKREREEGKGILVSKEDEQKM